MKKGLILILLAAMLLALAVPAGAASVSGEEAIEALTALGIVTGTGEGFEPARSATRAEALVMLLRLLGKEAEAAQGWDCPFADGGWAASYIGYAWKNGLVSGVSAARFGAGDPVSARDYLTMTLRALGYSDAAGGDFTWAESIAFADRIGLTHGEYTAAGGFLREDMALVTYTALTTKLKDGSGTLAEALYRAGVLSGSALKTTRLAGVVRTDAPVLSAAEIHERCASAVVLVEAYTSRETLEKNKADAQGSGFFVTSDGVAAMSYHELDGYSYARVTTLDGHRYELTGVLYYDVPRDIALVRVSRTDLEGNTVRFFPYLDVGDSDALGAGDRVYTVSNALGKVDSLSEGIVANRGRIVDDPAYPCLQVTAPFASGSSGGPLLNASGEAVGVIYGTFVNGQNMNLVVPINCLEGVALTGEGTPLASVCEAENAKKASATITAEREHVTLHIGEEQEILISHNCPSRANIRYQIESAGIVECVWGEFVTKQSVPLSIIGRAEGETDVTITFVSGTGNEDASTVIHVTVLADE